MEKTGFLGFFKGKSVRNKVFRGSLKQFSPKQVISQAVKGDFMDIIIKEAVAGTKDSAVVSKLAEEIWVEHYSGIISRKQVDYMLAKFQSEEAIEKQLGDGGYRYFVAYSMGKDGEEPVAYASFTLCPNNQLFLSKIYVKKEMRSLGIAGNLIDRAIQCYEIKKNFSIYLTVNKNNIVSIAAYKKLGFEITDNIMAEIGEGFIMDDYKMTKYYTNEG